MLIRLICCLLLCLLASSVQAQSEPRQFPSGTHHVFIPKVSGIRTSLLQNIAPIIERSIAEGYYPGGVILIGHHGKMIYRGVFGNRRVVPDTAPMRFNTLFDIASLTKVVATTPAVMQLIEQGKLDLDAAVATYWPDFAENGKETVTIRELLTHTSGLPAEIAITSEKMSEEDYLNQIKSLKLLHPPGSAFLYSDVNFMVLANLVAMISGEHFDKYVLKHIFKPLKMQHTFFLPSPQLRDQIAPTEVFKDKLRWGEVHDPATYSLGGVAGSAGLFSNAHDLSLYVQSLLQGGRLPKSARDATNRHFLGPLAILKMSTPQTPSHLLDTRGLGWDIDSKYSNRGVLFPVQSFGHSGWTGTSIWIDPTTKTWIIILTSRTHPKPMEHNQLLQDRKTIANIVSASIIDIPSYSQNNTSDGELDRAYKKTI